MKNLKTILVLCSTVSLGSCISTQPPTPPSPVRTEGHAVGIPRVSEPPNVYNYFNSNGMIERPEVERYYTALEVYMTYVKGYLYFIGNQYNLSDHRLTLACEEALSREITTEPLPPVPDLSDVSDDLVIDVLISHIGRLRSILDSFNKRINAKVKDVGRYCSR